MTEPPQFTLRIFGILRAEWVQLGPFKRHDQRLFCIVAHGTPQRHHDNSAQQNQQQSLSHAASVLPPTTFCNPANVGGGLRHA